MNKYEHNEHCKEIAEMLEAYAEGRAYRCPECGDVILLQEGAELNKQCPGCKHEFNEDAEELSIYDYFEDDIYDIEYRIGSDRKLRSVKIMVAFGGPNIYIDTDTGTVELYWWGERGSAPIDERTVDAIDDYFEELFNC